MKKTLRLLMALLLISGGLSAQESVRLTGKTICRGDISTGRDYAFDGNHDTYFATHQTEGTWVGLDLSTPCVITKIGWAPRKSETGQQRMLMGVFEGSNREDFMDAVPLCFIKKVPEQNRMTYADVEVSRGFRYVRYVSTNGGKCNIAEMEVYGYNGEGDDSKFYQITDIPTVSIHTTNAEEPVSKGVDIESNITTIYDGGGLIQEYPILTRVRGNYSATWANKPFRIKFNDEKKHHIFKDSEYDESPAKAKKWCLISCYGDKTLMRNPVAYEVSRRVGMPFTAWCKPVDLLINGEYRGTYQFTDHVDIKDDRVNIVEMTGEDIEGEALTGGYMIEMNGYAGSDPVNFTSQHGNPVTVHSPEVDVIQNVQYYYIRDYFNEMERRVFADNFTDDEEGYRSMLDIDTFLQYLLSNEISSNTDMFWQVYMYKQRNDPMIYTGPVWDNDLSLENDGNYFPGNERSDWTYNVRGAGTWRELTSRILSDKVAKNRLKEIWKDLRDEGIFTQESVAEYVDSTRQRMAESAHFNHIRWPYLLEKVHCNPVVWGSWDAEVDNVRNFLAGRVAWMDKKLKYGIVPRDPVTYRYYLLSIEKTGGQILQLGEVDILDENDAECPSLTMINCNTQGFGSETAENLTDNNLSTKLCCNSKEPVHIIFDARAPFTMASYRLYTANDTKNYPERNPKSWRLYGSNTLNSDYAASTWTLIDAVEDDNTMGATNLTPYDFQPTLTQDEIATLTVDGITERNVLPQCYDVMGRKVSDDYRGIIIRGGKKVMRKN